jgi:hypothetical protein
MEWSIKEEGNVTRMGQKRTVCKLLVREPEGRCWCADSIEMSVGEIELGSTDLINLTQDREK